MASNDKSVLTFSELSGNKSLMAFSTRNGGISEPPLNSLNFSMTQGDSQENVRANYRILARELDLNPLAIVTCRQIHGDNVEVLESVPASLPTADALVTATAGIFPAVKTADCLPILILDRRLGVAAAVHAGWRGTVLRITRKVIRTMKASFGCQPYDMVAALGPAIGPTCYEVDDVVLVPFRGSIPDPERFISVNNHSARESFRLDLALANYYELIAEGLPQENIRTSDLCTCCHPDLFFSHRRDGAASGRHIAVVGFRI
jgi:hypothetical protein